jgi:polyisoprenoid-binding protein YceI
MTPCLPTPPRLQSRPLAGACLLLLGLFSSPSLLAQAAGYRLDPVHTRVLFGVSHAGFSTALGTVSGSTGMLVFDPDDWLCARLRVEVRLARADMGDARWTRAVLARNMLDTDRYPVATFVSTRVEPVDPTHATACGTLTLHGVAREQCLDVTFNQLRRDPVPPFRRTAGFSATATLKRSDFGIDAWKSMIGDEVELRIEVEAVRDGDALEAIDASPGHANQGPPESTTPPIDDDTPIPPNQRVPRP